MNLVSSAQNLALKGTPRLLFLGVGVKGLAMLAELAFRGCREVASSIVPDRTRKWATKKLPKSITNLPKELSEYKFVKGLRSFNDLGAMDLAKTAPAYLLVSALGLWAMESISFIGKPHDIYNKVLNSTSYLQLRESGSPFTTMRETLGQITTRLFG